MKTLILAFALAVVSFMVPAFAAQKGAKATLPDVSADQIRGRAAKLKEMRDLLADKEPTVRLAAFSQMVDSEDTDAQEMAFDFGFSSADAAILNIALKKRLLRMSSFTVEVTKYGGDWIARETKAGRGVTIPNSISWKIDAKDMNAGILWFGVNNNEARGGSVSISGKSVSIRTDGNWASPGCRGTFILNDSNELTGPLSCSGFAGSNETTLLEVRMRVN
jgi:hypothetical protein